MVADFTVYHFLMCIKWSAVHQSEPVMQSRSCPQTHTQQQEQLLQFIYHNFRFPHLVSPSLSQRMN